VRELQNDFISGLDAWWPRLCGMPATMIHNDFNPRNLVLRQSDATLRLCAYDWELATLGAPQHDLAELLCFTWQSGMTQSDLDTIVDAYRTILSAACEQEIDPEEWREGFALALRHLLINRLAMYTLMNRFRPLDYLPRVMGNWQRLHAWSRDWSTDFGREC
jgi:aminoglycoside phosphotransferase (APT) family kinase protein